MAKEFIKLHGFPKLLSPFQGPNRFVALLPQSDKHPNTIMTTTCPKVLRKNFLSNFNNKLYGSRKLLIKTQFLRWIEVFRWVFFSRPPENMPTKLSLVYTWHITNVQNNLRSGRKGMIAGNVHNDRDIFTTKYFKPDTLSPPFWITQ